MEREKRKKNKQIMRKVSKKSEERKKSLGIVLISSRAGECACVHPPAQNENESDLIYSKDVDKKNYQADEDVY